jgi:Domain of unknown function (DUF305)
MKTPSCSHRENAMSPSSLAPIGLKATLSAVALLAAVAWLAPRPAGTQSIADYLTAICSTAFRSAPPDEGPFLAENVSAMTKMMIDMGIRPTGDVDSDFVAMMAPHHRGAIEMAQAELRYGRNERLRRMAQEIIITQQQEIAAMRLAIDLPLSPSVRQPGQQSSAADFTSKSTPSISHPPR